MSDGKTGISGYARPDRHWVCGGGPDGTRCDRGPGFFGRCRGPHRCHPVRSSEATRRLWGRLGLALALAFAVIILTADRALELIEPEPLSFSHAAISDCSICHAPADHGAEGWIDAAFGGANDGIDDVACLTCHDLGTNAVNVHSFDPAEIAHRRDDDADNTEAPWLLAAAREIAGNPFDADQGPPCVTCHTEHRGAEFPIAEMADDTCQACHAEQFASFIDGHPEFDSYPAEGSITLLFGHEAHFETHFEGTYADVAPTSCDACHTVDRTGRLMQVSSFESACGACHMNDILAPDKSQPLPGFAIPRVDVARQAEASHPVGSWPAEADGLLTDFTAWILAHDSEAEAALARIPGNDLASPEAPADAVATVAWRLKQLVREVRSGGPDVLVAFLGGTHDNDHHEQVRKVVFAMRLDEIVGRTDGWFPGLDADLRAWEAGDLDTLAATEAEAFDPDNLGPLIGEDDAMADPNDLGALIVSSGAESDLWHADEGAVWAALAQVYWPVDHEDTVMDFLLPLEPHSDEAIALRDAVWSPGQAGACAMCHTQPEHRDHLHLAGAAWEIQPSVHRLHGFTRYNHAPHLALGLSDGCQTCHRPVTSGDGGDHAMDTMAMEDSPPDEGSMNGADMNEAGMDEDDMDPDGAGHDDHGIHAVTAREFAPISIEVCRECHKPDNATFTCTTCHGYHVGHPSIVAASTPIDLGADHDAMSDGHSLIGSDHSSMTTGE